MSQTVPCDWIFELVTDDRAISVTRFVWIYPPCRANKILFPNEIIYPSLIELYQSRWLDIGIFFGVGAYWKFPSNFIVGTC